MDFPKLNFQDCIDACCAFDKLKELGVINLASEKTHDPRDEGEVPDGIGITGKAF